MLLNALLGGLNILIKKKYLETSRKLQKKIIGNEEKIMQRPNIIVPGICKFKYFGGTVFNTINPLQHH